ncbi:MAG: single-strand DNA-binding protein [Blastocatellia bacterium]
MASFNKIIVVGYLGKDPELRYTPDGTPVCNFSVATTERRKDKTGEFQDQTTWFRVSFFGRQAEVASQYLSKGRQVYVEGTLTQREYTDREGNTRTSLDVRGSDIQFIGPRGDESSGSSEARPAKADQSVKPSGPISDDDIPF